MENLHYDRDWTWNRSINFTWHHRPVYLLPAHLHCQGQELHYDIRDLPDKPLRGMDGSPMGFSARIGDYDEEKVMHLFIFIVFRS